MNMFSVKHFIQYGGFSKIKLQLWHLFALPSVFRARDSYGLATSDGVLAAVTHASYDDVQFIMDRELSDDVVQHAVMNAIGAGNIDAYRAIVASRPLEMDSHTHICTAATTGRLEMLKHLMAGVDHVDVTSVITVMCAVRREDDITQNLLMRCDSTDAM
jgi:hypothetical protein